MRILGIASNVHLSSAALIEDGRIVAAAAEERFSRQKHSRRFPHHAIDYCLAEGKTSLRNVDTVAVSSNPALELRRKSRRHSETIRHYPEALYAVPNQLAAHCELGGEATIQRFGTADAPVEVVHVAHHLAHAANAMFLSRFSDAAILTVDGRGESATATFGMGSGTAIELIEEMTYPHSLGLFYGAVTEFLGYRIDRDEWKVMGLAAYGNPDGQAYRRLRPLIQLDAGGGFELDLRYFQYFVEPYDGAVSAKFISELGPPRGRGEEITERHRDVAAATQRITEEVLIHMLGALHRRTRQSHVVVGGGVFMNSVFNGKIETATPFRRAFISSCPDDSGTSIGAALYAHAVLKAQGRPEPQVHQYFGPGYEDETIAAELARFKLRAERIERIESYAADQLAAGKLVGWFQGRMEFGQRALGNRSILADPRDGRNRDRLNQVVKFREGFRPFAPALLAEDFSTFFDATHVESVPFMERTLAVRAERVATIPAAVHVDGTARPQTVTAESNLRFHRLLAEFKRRTGVGVLVNTSFNVNDEPIVCTPSDAIRAFYSSGLDVLVLGNFVLVK